MLPILHELKREGFVQLTVMSSPPMQEALWLAKCHVSCQMLPVLCKIEARRVTETMFNLDLEEKWRLSKGLQDFWQSPEKNWWSCVSYEYALMFNLNSGFPCILKGPIFFQPSAGWYEDTQPGKPNHSPVSWEESCQHHFSNRFSNWHSDKKDTAVRYAAECVGLREVESCSF